MNTGVQFPRVHLHLVSLYSPMRVFVAWYLVKYRDKFTFTLNSSATSLQSDDDSTVRANNNGHDEDDESRCQHDSYTTQ